MKERKFRMVAGCKTNGTTDFQLGNICSDPECGSCSRFTRLFKEEVERQVKEFENKPEIEPISPLNKGSMPYKGGLKREHIKEAAEYLFRNQDKK